MLHIFLILSEFLFKRHPVNQVNVYMVSVEMTSQHRQGDVPENCLISNNMALNLLKCYGLICPNQVYYRCLLSLTEHPTPSSMLYLSLSPLEKPTVLYILVSSHSLFYILYIFLVNMGGTLVTYLFSSPNVQMAAAAGKGLYP